MNTLEHKLDVASLLDSCLDMFEDLIQRKEVALVKETGHGHLDVHGDEASLKPIFGYLILSAIGTMEGEKHKLLSVRTAIDNPWVSVDIEDTGDGVFEACKNEFFNSGQTIKKSGLAIGLPIVNSVVTYHGGQVLVSGREGKGTVITVRLPIIETETNELSIQH